MRLRAEFPGFPSTTRTSRIRTLLDDLSFQSETQRGLIASFFRQPSKEFSKFPVTLRLVLSIQSARQSLCTSKQKSFGNAWRISVRWAFHKEISVGDGSNAALRCGPQRLSMVPSESFPAFRPQFSQCRKEPPDEKQNFSFQFVVRS